MNPSRILLAAVLSLGLACCSTVRKAPSAAGEKNPQDEYGKAVIAWKYGFPDQALEYLNQSLSLNPRHAPSFSLLGLIYIQKRDFSSAIDVLKKSLEIQPDSPETLNRLGTAYQEAGETGMAKDEFRKALALDGNAYAAFHLAKIELKEGGLEQALGYVDASIGKDGRQAGSQNLRGVILNQMERYPEAVAAFETALALNPKDTQALINLGIALMNAARYEDARKAFEKALSLLEDSALRDKVAEYLTRLKDAEQ